MPGTRAQLVPASPALFPWPDAAPARDLGVNATIGAMSRRASYLAAVPCAREPGFGAVVGGEHQLDPELGGSDPGGGVETQAVEMVRMTCPPSSNTGRSAALRLRAFRASAGRPERVRFCPAGYRRASARASSLAPSGRSEQRGHPPCQLLRAHVLHVGGDDPAMPERIDDEAVPVAVELVLRSALHGGAESGRPLHYGVHVLHIDELEDHGTAGRWPAWYPGLHPRR